MKKLTAKQNAFIGYMVSGCSKSEAYRRAYLTEKQCEKMDSIKVAKLAHQAYKSEPLRLEHERQLEELASYVNIDSRRYVMMLQRAADKAEEAKNFGAMIRAIELIGKHLGMYVERHEMIVKNQTVVEIKASIRHILAVNPQLLNFLIENNPALAEKLIGEKLNEEKELPMIDVTDTKILGTPVDPD